MFKCKNYIYFLVHGVQWKALFLKCTLADIIGGYQEKAFEDKEARTFGLSFSGKLSNWKEILFSNSLLQHSLVITIYYCPYLFLPKTLIAPYCEKNRLPLCVFYLIVLNVHDCAMYCLFCLFIVDNLFAGIMYDPRSKGLVTSNKPGVLQFYLPQSDHHAFSVSYLPEII